jgi:DNA-binding response OmpR family regulator
VIVKLRDALTNTHWDDLHTVRTHREKVQVCRTGDNMARNGRRLRIYLVEDSPRLLGRLKDLFAEIGAQVIGHADSASAAGQEIVELVPDVAIVDIGLRAGNGFDVLRTLERRKGVQHTISIVLTNFTSEPYRAAAKRLGAAYFFDKNTEIMTMLGTVAGLIRTLGGPQNAPAC